MSEDVNPYETPKVNTELDSVVPNVFITNQYEMVNTRFVALLSKALLGIYAVVFSLVTVWNFKLAYEYDLLDEWSGLDFLSYEDMAYIEETGNIFLFYGCAIVVAIWISKSMRNAWAMRRSGYQLTISPG